MRQRVIRRLSAFVLGAAVLVVPATTWAQPAAAPAQPALSLDQPLPVDASVRTGQLASGLRYYLRRNGRPVNRVSMRLAVNVGSIHEENDQRGLAHFLEHMAFNGTQNFKPGELITFLETIGARFGPHVNAYTSFDETVYMLDVPSDKPGYVDRGLLALHDFAAGMNLAADEIEKERGVVIEEWRGRLGAGSRLTDKQLPVLLSKSRYAERLPIGTPEILKSFPRQRLVDFYQRWYRPDQMAVVIVGDIDLAEAQKMVQLRFGSIPAAKGALEAVDRTVPPHKETLFTIATDPEAQGSSVALSHKRPVEVETTVGDYRRSLDSTTRHANAQPAIARNRATPECAVPRGRSRRIGAGPFGRDVRGWCRGSRRRHRRRSRSHHHRDASHAAVWFWG